MVGRGEQKTVPAPALIHYEAEFPGELSKHRPESEPYLSQSHLQQMYIPGKFYLSFSRFYSESRSKGAFSKNPQKQKGPKCEVFFNGAGSYKS